MKLMQYVGGAPNGEFVVGRVYFAHDVLEYKGAESNTAYTVTDENKIKRKYEYTDQYFEMLDEVYVCCVTDSLPDFEIGEVLLVLNADDDSYEIAGYGFFKMKNFEVIDDANVQTGNYVQDISTGKWEPISRRQGGKIIFDGETEWRDMDDFRFPVVDGCVAAYPFLYCVDADSANLTPGKGYFPKRENGEHIIIVDDTGMDVELAKDRFSVEKS